MTENKKRTTFHSKADFDEYFLPKRTAKAKEEFIQDCIEVLEKHK